MSERSPDELPLGEQPAWVRCPRVGRVQPIEEHLECPYCFGDETAVQEGERKRFCDFEPGRDPVRFGFPTSHGHYAWDRAPKKEESTPPDQPESGA